jgi:hypothetical protein
LTVFYVLLPILGFQGWLIIDVNFALELLCRVLMGDTADVSEVHAATIFRV